MGVAWLAAAFVRSQAARLHVCAVPDYTVRYVAAALWKAACKA